MADEPSPPGVAASGAMASVPRDFFGNPTKLLQAVSEPGRWSILRELAAGPARAVQNLGAALKRDPDVISRQLHILRAAGAVAVAATPEADGRKQFYMVPEKFRRRDESGRPMIDYGVCVLRFP